jgi:hypothetical protein
LAVLLITALLTGLAGQAIGVDWFPITSWFDDQAPRIEAEEWAVGIAGGWLTLADLESKPRDTFPAILDCTGGGAPDKSGRGPFWTFFSMPPVVAASSPGPRPDTPAGSRFVIWRAPGW